MSKELEKIYNPTAVEDRLYAEWSSRGYFTPKVDRTKKPFTIVMPPPNVTGKLHMGHALDNTFQDIIIRAKRMQGYSALWVPGTDHAGIATQIKVEQALREEKGLTRHDIGREEFLKLVWAWKEKYGGNIIAQLKKLGSSCDWTRLRFTMDENLSRAVRKTFVSLYNKGLIYRGLRIINWCPKCATALSDAEVEHKDKAGHFWHIKYPIKDDSGYIIVATTRPETMLGDTAVAVHPEDERYSSLIGKSLVLPFMNREIPVIADEYVDREFGTGCVKITPCHDPNDYEMGLRHSLEMISVIDGDAKINENGGTYQGLDRYEARRRIIEDLDKLGLLVKVEDHSHAVGHCYRCGTVVEPLASKQWFVKMKPLAQPAIDIVKTGEISYIPDRFSKIYINWMENIRDWCISRQLWWGHRIPAYYCEDCGEVNVSETDLTSCPKCSSSKITQDEDVLDTWFSSALWPFSTLGWPDKTEDLEYFYPTNVLVTAYDIIPFWVARMIFSGIECMGQRPFEYVFIHGLIRDGEGRKMSKSLGNGIDPIDMIEKYGADALRHSFATSNSPGNDMRFTEEKAEASRNFANKIWNAARFILMNLETEDFTLPETLQPEDRWIISHYNNTVREVTQNLDKYELGVATSCLYDFIWDIFCDWYIELVKPRLFDKGTQDCINAQRVLVWVFGGTLKLLHPIMPFITEEIWQSLPHEGESIMVSPWPVYDEMHCFEDDERRMQRVIDAIRAIRIRRAEMSVPPSKRAKLLIDASDKESFNENSVKFFQKLAYASSVEFVEGYSDSTAVQIITDGATVYIPLAEMVDFEKERVRLNKEKDGTLAEISRVNAKLGNEGFMAKAPAKVIEEEREKLSKFTDMLSSIEQALAKLG
ncbi:MAG: valine--tRNA ligase [Eubacteriales bacterium]